MSSNLFANLEGCWVSVADFVRDGGPKLSGIDWSSSEHQEDKLQIGTTVLSLLECMFH